MPVTDPFAFHQSNCQRAAVKIIKAFIANVEQISGKPDLRRVDLTFEDALPDETVEIAFADLPMTGMRVVHAIATTRETAVTISGEVLVKTHNVLNVLCFAPNEIIRLENKVGRKFICQSDSE